jgi:DNA-directed RNA polymerase specialized sigma24 family protein
VSDPPSAPASVHPAVDFTAFYEQQRDHVRYWLGARVLDGQLLRPDVGDVLQDTFLRAWESRFQCREPAKWIIGIAKHALLEYGRQRGLWRKRQKAAELVDCYEHATGAVRRDDSGECQSSPKKTEPDGPREQVGRAALDELTARLLHADPSGRLIEALRLRHAEGLCWEKCATKVGWSGRWLRKQRAAAGLHLTPQHQRDEREGGG